MNTEAHQSQWSGEAGAWRLFKGVQDACVGGEDLPTRLEAGLRGALEMLRAEPELAHQMTVAPFLAGEDPDGLRKWIGRFGVLLRDAADADPLASREPSFLAPFLIGGVRFQIGRSVLSGGGRDLLDLLPVTLEALLAYYFGPGEPRGPSRTASGRRE